MPPPRSTRLKLTFRSSVYFSDMSPPQIRRKRKGQRVEGNRPG
jgi:hypothetical protein